MNLDDYTKEEKIIMAVLTTFSCYLILAVGIPMALHLLVP